jgi:hypothetical protein
MEAAGAGQFSEMIVPSSAGTNRAGEGGCLDVDDLPHRYRAGTAGRAVRSHPRAGPGQSGQNRHRGGYNGNARHG